ncbi:class I SAM-dependent DNA methyltransferase [Micromonospora sp. NPDC050417]|uniref:class I SAM-dependent DNA methyltransferase n=1 Tax=Micromonospora sp. NPDC050417 TaxID=3364280 RepID=UPI0037B1BD3F
MVDHHFADSGLAELYDLFHPWQERDDLGFYLPLVMAAENVLDIGCGTGMLLHRARSGGHTGRLCGLDPAHGMLEQARSRPDIEWVTGDLGSVSWDQEFDLAVMTGHAFQVLLTDEDLRTALAAVRSALTGPGRFAFETRNPTARTWERWTPENAVETTGPTGAPVRMEHQVETPLDGDLVSFTTTYTSPGWDGPRISRSTLRFLDRRSLAAHLTAAGLTVERQYGDWTGNPVTATSPEIITIARRS